MIRLRWRRQQDDWKDYYDGDDAYDYHSHARLSHVVTISIQRSGFNKTHNRQEVVLVNLSFVSVSVSVSVAVCVAS